MVNVKSDFPLGWATGTDKNSMLHIQRVGLAFCRILWLVWYLMS